MKTFIKMRYSKKYIFYLVFILCFSNIIYSYAQSDEFSNLRIQDIQSPDTVEIGETITLTTKIVNENSRVFSTDLTIYYDFQSEPSNHNHGEYDEVQGLQNLVIQPGDSVLITKQIHILEPKFSPNTTSIIIIWPEIASLRSSSLPKDHTIVEFYVNQKRDDSQLDFYEEDTNEEFQLEEENTDNEDGFTNSDEFYQGQNNKSNVSKELKFKTKEDNQNFQFIKNSQYVVINNLIDDVELNRGFVFNFDGRLISQINSNADLPLKIDNNAQPVIIQLYFQNKKEPEIKRSFIKIL